MISGGPSGTGTLFSTHCVFPLSVSFPQCSLLLSEDKPVKRGKLQRRAFSLIVERWTEIHLRSWNHYRAVRAMYVVVY